ncbi:MAG: preprotein translocase subunit YajC [Clostridia bacterium]|nr:preprotein translocase subunit YajC [Clostridia bacterium]
MLEETAPAGGGAISLLITLVPLVLVFYFFIYRPQKKQEKETADMRNSIELGDVICPTGGIVAIVVKITADMLLVETSGNRTKIQIQKWAVHSVLEKANEPAVKEVKDSKVDSNVKMKK